MLRTMASVAKVFGPMRRLWAFGLVGCGVHGCVSTGEVVPGSPYSSNSAVDAAVNLDSGDERETGLIVDETGETHDSAPEDTGIPADPTRARGTYPFPERAWTSDDDFRNWAVLPDLDGDGRDEVLFGFERDGGVSIVQPDPYGGRAPVVRRLVSDHPSYVAAWDGGFAVFDSEGGWFFDALPPDGALVHDAPVGPMSEVERFFSVPDLTGDGLSDFVAQRVDDQWYVFTGPAFATPDWSAAYALLGEIELAGVADMDGDGAGDLVMTQLDSYEISIAFGPVSAGTVDLNALPQATVAPPWPWEVVGEVVLGAGSDGAGATLAMVASQSVVIFQGVHPGETLTMPDTVLEGRGIGLNPTADRVVLGCDGDANGIPGLIVQTYNGALDYAAFIFDDIPPSTLVILQADATITGEEGQCADFGAGAKADVVVFDHGVAFFKGLQQEPGDDADLDGFPKVEDCDDLDATLHPYASELSDGIDQDCDGVVDDRAGAAVSLETALWTNGGMGNGLGVSLAAFDADGDGVADLAFGGEVEAEGSIWFVSPGRTLAEAIATRSVDGCGWLQPLGDTDGDGASELYVSNDDGSEWILHQGITGDGPVHLDPNAVRLGSDAGFLGGGRDAGDTDGDGLSDVVVGIASAAVYSESPLEVFAVLHLGGEIIDGVGPENGASIFTLPWGDSGWFQVASGGDPNGDGYDDILATIPDQTHLLLGPTDALVPWTSFDAAFDVRSAASAPIDLDADGRSEVVLVEDDGVFVLTFEGIAEGAVYLRDDARTRWSIPERGDNSTVTIATHPEVPGTLFVGVPTSMGGAVAGGRVYLVDEFTPGEASLNEVSTAWFDALSAVDLLGTALSLADYNGDGSTDLAVGVPGSDRGAPAGGAVVVVP